MDIQYRKTGSDINLPVDILINFVMEKCKEYDTLIEVTQSRPIQSPYSDPVIFTTDEGKTVQVPDYVQQQAIQQWTADKNMANNEINKLKTARNTTVNPDGYSEDMGIQELPINYHSGDPVRQSLRPGLRPARDIDRYSDQYQDYPDEDNDKSNFTFWIIAIVVFFLISYAINNKIIQINI